MDTALHYDTSDPAKQHHPLITREIKLHDAHNVIHWGLCIITVLSVIATIKISPNPDYAISCLIFFIIFGYSYNSGLSKESLFGFLAISICFTSAAAWGWFLSHESLTSTGTIYLTYVFLTILFQISWSGFIKDLEIKERSNLLLLMGAQITKKKFKPGNSAYYGFSIKIMGLFFGWILLSKFYTHLRLIWTTLLSIGIFYLLLKLVLERKYIKSKELLNMSLMEILTIYLPIPIVLPYVEAMILMVFGVVYFFSINLLIWKTPYPAV